MIHELKIETKKRGYWGIAFYEPKTKVNIGTAIRSANCFGCNFISLIGSRFKHQASDTMKTEKHVPIFEYDCLEDFLHHLPRGCGVVGVEMDGTPIRSFSHPERVIYLFGGEDRNVPEKIENRVKIDTSHCLNMAVAASIIMFDRQTKLWTKSNGSCLE